MYIFARIIGLITYLTILLIVTFLINKAKPNKIKVILLTYNIALAIIAFLYVPNQNADLYRLIKISEEYGTYVNESNFLKYLLSSRPLEFLLLYINGKIGIYHLLPAFASTIFYGIVFKIIIKAYEDNNISNENLAKTLFVFMILGQYAMVISGIRSFIVFAVISYCYFKELYYNINPLKHFFIYIIMALLHPTSIVFLGIRILYLLLIEKKNAKSFFLAIILICLSVIITLTIGNKYVIEMLNLADIYINKKVYSYFWEYLIAGLTIIMLLGFNITLKLENKKLYNLLKANKKIYNIYKFNNYFTIILLLFSFEYSIFTRFLIVLTILYLPIMMFVFENRKIISDRNNKLIKFYILALNVIIFSLVFTRGNLTGLKFF